MSLTPEQERAVNLAGRDLCVRAGAGSGKTRVLVERAVALVTREVDPFPLSRLLAITFTDKAAREMKNRLSEELSRRRKDELRAEVEWACVSTIHAFCARLLRENALEAGLDPAFGVLDEFASRALLREALAETAATFEEAAPGRSADLARLAGRAIEEESIVLLEAIRSAGSCPADLAVVGPDPDGLREALAGIARTIAGASVSPKAPDEYRERFERCREIAGRLESFAEDPPAAAAALAGIASAIDLRRFGKEDREALRAAREEAVPRALGLAAGVHAHPALLSLRDYLVDLDARYRRIKARAGVLDFSDLEEKALALLSGDAEVREAVRDRFRQVLVDEYQDVNPRQEAILRLLARPGERFAVGDVKQSIYGFRHARPELFGALATEAGPEGVVELRHNFRSSRALVAFANRVFGELFRDQPLVAWTDIEAVLPDPPGEAVEVLLTGGDSAAAGRVAEAGAIARHIRAMEAEGACAFRDVAVLLRAFGDLKTYERAFEEHDVPYYVVKGRGFFEAREIVDLSRMLRAVVKPRDEVSLAAALRSPFAGLTEDGLLALAAARSRSGGNLADLLSGPEVVPGLSEGDLDRWCRFAAMLGRLRGLAGRAGPAAVAEAAVAWSGYETAVWLLPGGRRRAANFRKAVVLAGSLGGGLPEFLEALEDFRARAVRETEAPTGGEADDVVRILTVHAAKGLEFPVVFLPDLCRPPRLDQPALCFGEGGLAARVVLPEAGAVATPLHARLVTDRRRREEEESIRLLYVAVTRAERRLILSAREGSARRGTWWARLAPFVEGCPVVRETGEPSGAPRRAALVDLHAGSLADCAELPGPGPSHRESADRLAALAATSPPASDGRSFENTVSELIVFGACPLRHRWRYLLGVPEYAAPDRETDTEAGGLDELPPREAGIAVHETLRDFDPRGTRQLLDVARDRVRSIRGIGDESLAGEVAGLVESFYDGCTGREVLAGDPGEARREIPFLVRWAPPEGEDRELGLILRGTVDLLYRRPDGQVRIVDVKTGGAPPERYRVQMAAYARALGRFLDEPLTAVLVYLAPGCPAREVEVAVDGPAQAEFDALALSFARHMRDRGPLARPPYADCVRCPYAPFCPEAEPSRLGGDVRR
jgi:ATP-dependent helicase/nuclease subunit A